MKADWKALISVQDEEKGKEEQVESWIKEKSCNMGNLYITGRPCITQELCRGNGGQVKSLCLYGFYFLSYLSEEHYDRLSSLNESNLFSGCAPPKHQYNILSEKNMLLRLIDYSKPKSFTSINSLGLDCDWILSINQSIDQSSLFHFNNKEVEQIVVCHKNTKIKNYRKQHTVTDWEARKKHYIVMSAITKMINRHHVCCQCSVTMN